MSLVAFSIRCELDVLKGKTLLIIVIIQGKVKQIVGSTLKDLTDGSSTLVTNFESDKSAAEFARLYKEDKLAGGHVIMLGADPLSIAAALEALHVYPGTVILFSLGNNFACICMICLLQGHGFSFYLVLGHS